MHVVLLTLMTLSGADPIAVQQASGAVTYPSAAYHATGCSSCGSSACNGSACGHGGSHYDRRVNRQLQHYMSGSRHGPMPQTCYSPRYGCYHGNDRHMHRYPAFHGTYYRRPYNYRNLFEYPWHAEMHEPTSYFSYNVPPEAMNAPPMAPLQDAPPAMPIDAAARRQAQPRAPQVEFAPPSNRSAGMTPGYQAETVQFLPPPRLNDQDLAGVKMELEIEQQRVAPAPIESTADATPYDADAPRQLRSADAPRAASSAPAATPVMLRPVSNVKRNSLPAGEETLREAPQAVPSQSLPAKPISARRSAGAEAQTAAPQVKAKVISLGQPQSIELKPLAPENQVTQADIQEQAAPQNQVQHTSANQPIDADKGLRANEESPAVNPLRASLRR